MDNNKETINEQVREGKTVVDAKEIKDKISELIETGKEKVKENDTLSKASCKIQDLLSSEYFYEDINDAEQLGRKLDLDIQVNNKDNVFFIASFALVALSIMKLGRK